MKLVLISHYFGVQEAVTTLFGEVTLFAAEAFRLFADRDPQLITPCVSLSIHSYPLVDIEVDRLVVLGADLPVVSHKDELQHPRTSDSTCTKAHTGPHGHRKARFATVWP